MEKSNVPLTSEDSVQWSYHLLLMKESYEIVVTYKIINILLYYILLP